ncbi:unnamed protein product [Absidia cylindrospora]
MNPNTTIILPTTISLPQSCKGYCLNEISTLKQLDDTVNNTSCILALSANDRKSSQQYQEHQDLHQRSVTNLIPSTEPSMHTPSKKTTMPVAPTADNDFSGDPNTYEKGNLLWPWNSNDVPNQGKQDVDTTSIADSSSSIDCEDFPNPPSSTPSLTIKTNTLHQHGKADKVAISAPIDDHRDCRDDVDRKSAYSSNKFATKSRFTEVFDIRGTELEIDYHLNYRHQYPTSSNKIGSTLHSIKKDQHFRSSSSSSSSDDTSSYSGQSTRIGNFINIIGRTVSSSSPSVSTSIKAAKSKKRTSSTSSGSNSIRGLIRSLSTTATNRYHHPKSKNPTTNTNDEMTKAAQVVAATTKADAMKTQHYLPTEEICINNTYDKDTSLTSTATSIDGHQRQKISSLLYNALHKTPARRHTTKIVNMDSSKSRSTKKLARRTVIYVNPDSQLNFDDLLENLQQQYQHHQSPHPFSTQSEHYRLVKKLPPSPPSLDKSAMSPPSSTSHAHSISSILSDASSSISTSNNPRPRKPSCIEGFELREMDDGTVEWGIVKEEGNRKSFFLLTMDEQQIVDNDEDR